MKKQVSLISLTLSALLYSSHGFTETVTSCGEGCTKTETIDDSTNTHKVVIDGNKTKSYSTQFDTLQSNKKYHLINYLHLENSGYKIYVPEWQDATSAEIINYGKLISQGSGVTSAIDAQWGNITEKLHVTNYGEIRTEGGGYNECGVCSSYFKRNDGGRIKAPTEVVYEVNNLGKDALISANGGFAIWLDNGKSSKINNEGTISSKSTKVPTILIRYANNAEVKNSGTINSQNQTAVNIQHTSDIKFFNTGKIQGGDAEKTLVLLNGDNISFINSGVLEFTQQDSTKRNRAITLNGSKKAELILQSGSKISGIIKANPNNSYLILEGAGEETGLIHDKVKFEDFNTFIMRGNTWTLSGPFSFNQLIKAESGKLTLKEGSLTAPNIQLNTGTTFNFTTDYTLNGTTNNQGSFTFEHQEPTLMFKHLTINGNYRGDNGVLHLFADFNGSTNLTDKLRINGKAEGTTRLAIKHIGKSDEKAVNDVKIIETQQSTHNAFVIDDYLSKGAFVYHLEKRNENNQDNWYLTSYINGTPSYRPEMAGYANNLYAANHLFNLRLEDRLAHNNFINQSTDKSLWLRLIKGTTTNQMQDQQNKTQARRYIIQLGKDMIKANHYKVGGMFGYAKQHNKIESLHTRPSRAKIQGYALGIYSTWYQNTDHSSGLYVDGWLQYQWFKNQVINPDLVDESYRSRGFSTSLETGYRLPLIQYRVSDWAHRLELQPQAQMIWQGVSAKQYIDKQGTVIDSLNNHNLQTRLGIKLSLDSHLLIQQFNIKPYLAFNWLHNTKTYGITMDGVINHIQGTKHLLEYKAGVESQWNDSLQFWADTTHRRGKQNFKDNQLNLGFRILF
ncbi:autotransporter outer membrane beta-barrel domain-containing protein [Pasteurella canis]|uniref:autotransporter family protein n=1 Tax=Pasteurella canis TaxID=753 RepID=UPI001D0F6091|nr:autotransporter outer membrane beta-barrel domain-containing protein [Pasteurella canis]UDW83163.1 autotransporter outer membrane beta-barrel domain-containing protein [Pasteurella canis]